jgi:AraC-like DNA-binding protein
MASSTFEEAHLSSSTAEAPPLAGRAGHYKEQAPVAALRRHFRCAWTNVLPEDHSGSISVVPDGCVDIVWNDGSLHVAGPDLTAATPLFEPNTTIVGVRFQPGAARNWLGLPMSEIVGLQVELEELWGAVACDIAKRMEDALSVEGRSAALQHELLCLVAGKEEPARDVAAVFGLMQGDARRSDATISTILDRLDTSPRTLRRRCHEHFGYGPKTLDRILRFQRLLMLARSSPRASLAGMAYEVGYADQAHMSREVRELTGLSAKAFVSGLAA